MYPPRLADELRRRGHDVVAVAERPELRTTDDEPLLMTATTERRALVTENVADYPDIVAALALDEKTHGGVVLVASRTFPRTERGFGMLMRALEAYLVLQTDVDAVPGGVHWLQPTPDPAI